MISLTSINTVLSSSNRLQKKQAIAKKESTHTPSPPSKSASDNPNETGNLLIF